MTLDALSVEILLPAFVAGAVVAATHVPLGMQVLARGIVFIDLAVAQIAGLGVILASWLGWEPQGAGVQVAALAAALLGALGLTWTERHWPEVQEAIIGTAFVVAASLALLLLANDPHGGEHLKDLLVGQILWISTRELILQAVAGAVILGLWMGYGPRLGRAGFYVLFACAVTASVQLVGLYLVFATLIVPALATCRVRRRRLAWAYGTAVSGYGAGLALSAVLDLPSGAMIVCTMTLAGALVAALNGGDRARYEALSWPALNRRTRSTHSSIGAGRPKR
jgi:zinc/manganese transport system permease protein